MIERALRSANRDRVLARLGKNTAAYYDSLTAIEVGDDAALARASAKAARRLDFDYSRSASRRARRRAR